jgi:Mlc titration factor MtfA (ptsG expression regulator)
MEILIIFLVVFGIIVLQGPVIKWYNYLYEKRQYKLFLTQETVYHAIVAQHLKYYTRLSTADQHKFLFRTYLFKKAKKFHYIEVEESAEMPILISATAVQLTFGLEKYLFNFFRDIYVLKDDYHYGFYSRPFEGHVDHSGIYLSWDKFIKGVKGFTPGCNMGLHEMGHALAYVNFISQTEEDRHFKKEWMNFSKVARPIFESMRQGAKNLLDSYAGTNYQEFWAVSVEVFFENPVRMRHEMPELYNAMTTLLHQDPIEISSIKKLAA